MFGFEDLLKVRKIIDFQTTGADLPLIVHIRDNRKIGAGKIFRDSFFIHFFKSGKAA
jgi:hypothetical protein